MLPVFEIAEEALNLLGYRARRNDFSQQDIEELAAAIQCCSHLKELVWTCKWLM